MEPREALQYYLDVTGRPAAEVEEQMIVEFLKSSKRKKEVEASVEARVAQATARHEQEVARIRSGLEDWPPQ